MRIKNIYSVLPCFLSNHQQETGLNRGGHETLLENDERIGLAPG